SGRGIERQVPLVLGQILAKHVGKSAAGTRVVDRGYRESVGARAVLGLICRNASDHDRSTRNAWICCVNRRKGQRDRLVARWGAVTQVRRVVGGRRARGVAVGLAERGNLPTLVRPVVDPHGEGPRRGIVAEVDVLDVPPRDPSAVAGHGGPLAEALSIGVDGNDLGGQVIGVGGVEVLLY